jgi:predicted nucleotidyltransferase
MNNPFYYPGFRILTAFFDEPYREFHLREIAKLTGVSSSTAKRYLDFYSKNDFLAKSSRANLVLLKANLESLSFRYMKLAYFTTKLMPLTDFFDQALPNASIVLYGSCARGEDDPQSDVDLLIVGRKTGRLDFGRFEKRLERRITVLTYTQAEWEEKAKKDRAFYERILIDGIVLQGNLPVVNFEVR